MSRPKRVWITGATGFTGRHLVDYLRGRSEPVEIVGLDCRPAPGLAVDEFHEIDLTDLRSLRPLASALPPSRVFHLAGLFSPSSEAELWRVNVGGTQSLLRALSEKPAKDLRIVSVGSAAEYLPSRSLRINESEPCGGQSPYGRSKWAQTSVALACAREWGLRIMIARTFNLLGPGLSPDLVAGSLCKQFAGKGRRNIKVGDLRPLRDFIDVRDAVAAYWRICEKGRSGQIYNVCRGRATRISSLVDRFMALNGGNKTIVEEAVRLRPDEASRVCGDHSKLQKLGWKASISLGQSVGDMLKAAR